MRYVLAAALLLPLFVCAAQDALPFVNAGFEMDENSDGLPDGWDKRIDEPGGVRLDARVRHSGERSVRISHTKPASYSSVIQTLPNRRPGERMVASVWVKCEGIQVRGIGPRLYCGYEGGWGHTARGPVMDESGSCDWQQVVVPFNTRDKSQVQIHLYLHESTGTIWFDDFQVRPEPVQFTAQAATVAPSIDGDPSEAAWQEGPPLPLVSTDTGEAEPAAWAKLAHDALAVYACVRVPADASAAEPQRVSLLVDTGGLGEGAAEWWIDAEGNLGAGGVEQSAPRGDWQGAARSAEGALDVEFAIPLATLQPSMRTAERWKVSVVCARLGKPELELAFTGLNPRKPVLFADVSFPGLDVSPYRVRELRERLRALIGGYKRTVDGLRIATIPDTFPAKQPVRVALDELGADIEVLSREAGALGQEGVADWDGMALRLSEVEAKRDALQSQALPVAAYAHSRKFAKKPTWGVTVVSAMQKVLREPELLAAKYSATVDLAVARGEAESAQLVVLPLAGALKGVKVSVPKALQGSGKGVLRGECIDIMGVGYVPVEKPNHPRSADVPMWPDMLLPCEPLNVAEDQVAPIWLTLTCPRDAAPGVYTGKITLTAEKAHKVVVDLRVRVYGFELPVRPALKTSFGMGSHWIANYYYGEKDGRKHIDGPTYRRWCDELLRHRVSPYLGIEYRPEKNAAGGYEYEPWEGNIAHCVENGLTSMMLSILPATPNRGPDYTEEFKQQLGEQLRAMRDRLKERGWLDLAYVCAWDEPQAGDYAGVLAGHRLIRETCPDLRILQTACYDDKPEGLVGSVDIWCPITSRFNPEFYAARQRAGEEVWWYVCCGPRPPMANFFVDQDAIDHRVLFWQTWQRKVTGLLYWQTTWWEGNCVEGGAMRQADPATWVSASFKQFRASGDGHLLYPGANVTPLPSLRLAVIRDGIEDYDYLALLQGLAAKHKDMPSGVTGALAVDDTISGALSKFTKDPQVIEARRRAIGEMIERLSADLRGAAM